jgi:hypothetical protein
MWGAGTGAAPVIMKQNASTRATTSSAHATPRRHPGSISRQLVASGSFVLRRIPSGPISPQVARHRPRHSDRPVGMSPTPMRRGCCCAIASYRARSCYNPGAMADRSEDAVGSERPWRALFMRTAEALESSAGLAERHARREDLRGDLATAAKERDRARRARRAALRARDTAGRFALS